MSTSSDCLPNHALSVTSVRAVPVICELDGLTIIGPIKSNIDLHYMSNFSKSSFLN
ncbi:TPA: hypothetical protein QCQ37_004153 [Bacillus cereus]|nr:hypothetical protein [Bacillus cereus]